VNLHKAYLVAIAVGLALLVVVGFAWTAHVKDEAKRDAVIDSQKIEISRLEDESKAAYEATMKKLADLEQQKAQVIKAPSEAPEVLARLLHELNPQASPIQQTAPVTKEMPPDAPSAVLTKQNQIDLAGAALTCKQCFLEKEQLKAEVQTQAEIIDRQETELAAAMKAAKGGSVWQRTKTILKWGGIGGAIGYALAKAH
jgi:hypothetical protein